MKLHQVIAIEKSTASESHRRISDLHHQSLHPELFNGRIRTYAHFTTDEAGGVPIEDQLPDEVSTVALQATDVLQQLADSLKTVWDLTGTKDYTNASASARADLVVDGKKLIENMPVPFILFLEKQLENIKTFVTKMPTLALEDDWSWNADHGAYVSKPTQAVRSKKVKRNHVLAEATKEHPAQVEAFTEDKAIGRYTTIKYSGALPVARKNEILRRITTLQHAALEAREKANSAEVTDRVATESVFKYLFA